MDNFDIVMEKAYSQKIEDKMKASYEKGKNIESSEKMKKANSLIKEARSLVKDGDVKKAKSKYKEAMKNIKECQKDVKSSIKDLDNSGDSKISFVKKILIILSTLASAYALTKLGNIYLTVGDKRGYGIAYGGQIASFIAETLGLQHISKDNVENYKQFRKIIEENPRKVLNNINKSLIKLYKSIEREMNKACA